jgi:hypothetical protein
MDLTSNGHAHPATSEWRLAAIAGAILLITFLAAALRLHQLGHGSFWLDELYTINSVAHVEGSHRSKVLGYVPTWIGLRLQGIDPSSIPRYEPHRWREMGVHEVSARLPTAIVGILSVPIIGLVACRLLGARAGVLAMLLLAIAPWHIYWSQAARFYVPQFLFYTLTLMLYYIATRSRAGWQSRCAERKADGANGVGGLRTRCSAATEGSCIGYRITFAMAMVMLVLAVMSQPTALIIVLVFGVDWAVAAWRGRPVRLGTFGWAAATVALGLCATLLAMDVGERPEQWTQFVNEPVRHQEPLAMLMGAMYMIGPGLACLAMLVAAHGLRASTMMNRIPGQSRQPMDDERMLIYLAAAGVLPVLIFAVVSGWAFVGLRYSFIALFPLLALAAIGLERMYGELRPRTGWMLAVAPAAVVLAELGLLNQIYFGSGGNFHARWGDAIAAVKERRVAGDAVAAGDPFLASYYLGEPVLPLPESQQHVLELEHPTWFVVHVTRDPQSTGRFWLFRDVELIDVFALRAVHANSSVQVYRHVPQRVREKE